MTSKRAGNTASFVADFETTTTPNDCRVWAWGVVDTETQDNFVYGNTIESFFEWCASNWRAHVYFHNLAFDGVFIIDRLFREGFEWVKDKMKLSQKQFSTLIDESGKFYTIEVKWANNSRTEFRDSLKKLPMSVDRIAEAYSTGFTKLKIDYDEYRPIGHELSPIEVDYLRNDVVIVAKALKTQFDEGMLKLTTGADSFAQYRSIMSRTTFKTVFPRLTLSMDSEIRKAYRGGWTYANPKFARRVVGGGMVFDVNSLYPSVMRTKLLPIGLPKYLDGAPEYSDDYPLAVFSVTITAKIKAGFLPCIQIKNSPYFLNTEYVDEVKDPTTIVCTNVDWTLWNEHYDIDIISWNGSYMFHGAHGLFDEYVDKWMDVKANSTGGLREIAKLHLNSLYGKFATNPDVTGKRPVMFDDHVEFVKNDDEFRDPVYTPIGVFITAWARDKTIRAAQDNYDIFAYADTDSLHLITREQPRNLEVHPTKLGAWKHELTFNSAFYARAKAYCEKVSLPRYHSKSPRYRYVTHIAGLPKEIADKVTLSDFKNGRVFPGKLRPRRVPGGVVLQSIDFTLKWL